MKDTDIAYIAGLLDGEGYIQYIKAICKADGYKRYRFGVSIASTDREIINWLKEVIPQHGRVEVKHPKNGRFDIYHLRWYGDNARQVLELCLPYMRIKRPQAELYLAMRTLTDWAITKGTFGKPQYPIWVRQVQDIVVEEFKKLHHTRGFKYTPLESLLEVQAATAPGLCLEAPKRCSL